MTTGQYRNFRADQQGAVFASDMGHASILAEHRAKERHLGPSPAEELSMLEDLSAEVGATTPPLRIYIVGQDGNLVLKEQITAQAFRDRAMTTVAGSPSKFAERVRDLRLKRQKAGARSKAKSRAQKIRTAGKKPDA